MESVVIETLDCPLDFNLSQSWEQDSSHTHTSSDYSESADEETEIKNEDNLIAQIKNLSFDNASDSKLITPKCSNETSDINSQEKGTSSDYSESDNEETEIKHDDDLIEQIKNLSFANASDSKYVTPKYSNKTCEINSQVKENSGKHISMENKKIEEIRSSSSSLKYHYEIPYEYHKETDVESILCKCPNKNCEIDSKKKNNTEKPSFEKNMEYVENQFSSLSLKNNKILNKYYKSGSGNSDEDESDSDDDEEGQTVILRERDPTRRNRSENNKPQRTTPFTRNDAKPSRPHFNLNYIQTFGNFSPPVLHGFNIPYDGYDSNSQTFGNFSPPISHGFNIPYDGYDSNSQINSNNLERCRIVSPSTGRFYTDFPTSGPKTCQVFRDMASSTATDVVDGGVPYAVPEWVVPSIECNGNSEETNDASFFDHSNGRRLPGYTVTNVEKETLDSCLENLSVEEMGNLLSSQNPEDLLCPLPPLSNEDLENVFTYSSTLNQNICVESPVKKISYQNNNQHNFHSKPNRGHSSFSKANIGDSTSDDISGQNPVDLLYPLPPLSSEDLENFFNDSSTSNQNICVESAVDKISYPNDNRHNFHSEPDNRHSYKQIKHTFIKANVEESGYYSKSVSKNISSINFESSSPETTDYERFSKEMEDKIKRIRSNDTKRKNNNKTCKTSHKTEEPKICTVYGTAARDVLFNSPSFCKRKWKLENEDIRNLIKNGELGTEEKTVIHMIPKKRATKYRGTNLHYAIRDENIEKVFCLVECHKECHGVLATEINFRDNSDKTVLDYSKEKGLDLLTAYLIENTAKSYSDICI